RRGIYPGPDGRATNRAQVCASAGRAAEIAGQRAHVVAAAGDEKERARLRQPMRQPPRLVQIDARRWQFDRLSAMRLAVGPLAVDALVARRRRHLVPPPDELGKSAVQALRGKPPPLA